MTLVLVNAQQIFADLLCDPYKGSVMINAPSQSVHTNFKFIPTSGLFDMLVLNYINSEYFLPRLWFRSLKCLIVV